MLLRSGQVGQRMVIHRSSTWGLRHANANTSVCYACTLTWSWIPKEIDLTTSSNFSICPSLCFWLTAMHWLTVYSFFLSRKMSQTRLKSWVQETGSPPGCSMSVLRLWVWVDSWWMIDCLLLHAADEWGAGRGRHCLHWHRRVCVAQKGAVLFYLSIFFITAAGWAVGDIDCAVFGCASRGQPCSGITCIPAETETIGPDTPPVRSCSGTSGVGFILRCVVII